MVTQVQVDQFQENGYLVLRSLAPAEIRRQLLIGLNKWVKQSLSHKANYGFDTPDSKARFDLEKGHSVQQPRLHRVANPCRISEAFQGVSNRGRFARSSGRSNRAQR